MCHPREGSPASSKHALRFHDMRHTVREPQHRRERTPPVDRHGRTAPAAVNQAIVAKLRTTCRSDRPRQVLTRAGRRLKLSQLSLARPVDGEGPNDATDLSRHETAMRPVEMRDPHATRAGRKSDPFPVG